MTDEYVIIDAVGSMIKLGNSDGLLNVRLDELYELVSIGQLKQYPGCNPPESYLTPQLWRYRFPFPDEDGQSIGAYEPYERRLRINIMRGSTHLLDQFLTDEKLHSPSLLISRGNQTASLSCPYLITRGKSVSQVFTDIQPEVEIVGTSLISDGFEIATVIRCPYCKSMIILDHTQGIWLADNAKRVESTFFYNELARRIKKGYEIKGNLGRYYVNSLRNLIK